MIAVLLGLGTHLLSRGRDGFDKGLFIGMTVAFMVLGVYLLSAAARSTSTESAKDSSWLPSRDDE